MNIVDQRDKLLFKIGETIVSFQGIDYYLTEFLYKLLRLNHKEKHLVLIDALSFVQKINLISEIFPEEKIRFDYIKDEFNFEIARKCLLKAEHYRNKIVHSFYFLENNQFKKQKSSIKGKNGLITKSGAINYVAFEECNKALEKLKLWYLLSNESLNEINQTFDKFNQA